VRSTTRVPEPDDVEMTLNSGMDMNRTVAGGAEWIHLVDLDAAFGRGSIHVGGLRMATRAAWSAR
jgi:phosphoribosylformimino-5-aminoimidazole carboxamide ribonucleotide (ProFAR) isomerase